MPTKKPQELFNVFNAILQSIFFIFYCISNLKYKLFYDPFIQFSSIQCLFLLLPAPPSPSSGLTIVSSPHSSLYPHFPIHINREENNYIIILQKTIPRPKTKIVAWWYVWMTMRRRMKRRGRREWRTWRMGI